MSYAQWTARTQTFVLDKGALEGHRSTCTLFVLSHTLSGGAQTHKCRQTLRGVCGFFIDASFYVHCVADMWHCGHCGHCGLARCQDLDNTHTHSTLTAACVSQSNRILTTESETNILNVLFHSKKDFLGKERNASKQTTTVIVHGQILCVQFQCVAAVFHKLTVNS